MCLDVSCLIISNCFFLVHRCYTPGWWMFTYRVVFVQFCIWSLHWFTIMTRTSARFFHLDLWMLKYYIILYINQHETMISCYNQPLIGINCCFVIVGQHMPRWLLVLVSVFVVEINNRQLSSLSNKYPTKTISQQTFGIRSLFPNKMSKIRLYIYIYMI